MFVDSWHVKYVAAMNPQLSPVRQGTTRRGGSRRSFSEGGTTNLSTDFEWNPLRNGARFQKALVGLEPKTFRK
jgi:hypothetical protein